MKPNDLPRMLYRLIPDGEPLDFDKPGNTLIVSSPAELEKALDDGWLAHPDHKSKGDLPDHASEEAKLRAGLKALVKPEPKPEPKSVLQKAKEFLAQERKDDRAEEASFERASDRAASKKKGR